MSESIGWSTLDIIPSAKGFAAALSAQAGPEMTIAGLATGQIFSKGMVEGIKKAGVVGAVAAIIGLALKTGSTFNQMEDEIRASTGATGKDLKALVADALDVSKTVPASFQSIGTVISGVHQRLGLTGPTLQLFTRQFLEAGRVTKSALDMNTVTGALSAFNVKGTQTTAVMDSIFQVSQATGVSINELLAGVKQGAPQFQAFGFSIQDSAALVGALDKAGVNSTRTIMGMQIALINFSKHGRDPEAALKTTVTQIDAFTKSGQNAKAIELAASIFGTRGASQFVEAIKSGKINMDNLFGSIGAGQDTIIKAGIETQHLSEQWQMLRKDAMTAIKPVADAVFATFTDGMKWLRTEGVPVLKAVSGWLANNHSWLTKLVIVLAATFAGWRALLIINAVAGAVGGFATAVMDGTIALKAMYAWELLVDSLNPFGWVALAVTGLALIYHWMNKISKVEISPFVVTPKGMIGPSGGSGTIGMQGPGYSIEDKSAISKAAKSAADAKKKAIADALAAANDAKMVADAAAAKAAAAVQAKLQLATAVENQKTTLADFARWLSKDFITSILDSSTKAGTLISQTLSNIGSAITGYVATIGDKTKADQFTLGATKITNLLNSKLYGFQDELDAVNTARVALATKIADAKVALTDAVKLRTDASTAIAALISKPFGQPSDLQKAFTGANATADTIIAGYNNLAKMVQDRFAQIAGPNKDYLISFLKTQTQRLISLAAQRVEVAKSLALSQTALDTAIADKKNYGDGISKSLSDASISLSQFTTQVTLADGRVTQMIASPSALIDAFQKRLVAVKNFAANVQSLAARGLGKGIIDQIVGMGADTGGALADSLSKASDAQISALQDSATQIDAVSTSLGASLSNKFYDGAVAQATAIRDGWQSQQNAIDTQMGSIASSVEDKLLPLIDGMTSIGTDSAQAFLDGLKSKDEELLIHAQTVGSKMAQAIADALTSLNVLSGGNNFGPDLAAAKAAAAKLADDAAKAKAKAAADELLKNSTITSVAQAMAKYTPKTADSQAATDQATAVTKAIADQAAKAAADQLAATRDLLSAVSNQAVQTQTLQRQNGKGD